MSGETVGTRISTQINESIGTRVSQPVADVDYALVVVLWERADFTGARRVFVEDTPDLSQFYMDVTPGAVGVHPGPNYERWKAAHNGQEPVVGLYQEPNYNGPMLLLAQGAYPNIIPPYFMRGAVFSIRFNPPPAVRRGQPAPAINPIPLVVTLYEHANFGGKSAVIIEDVPRLSEYLGAGFNDTVTSVRVKAGPNYVAGKKARLFRDTNYLGGEVQLEPGNYASLSAFNFNDTVSSIKVS